jgi:hypothetical protein
VEKIYVTSEADDFIGGFYINMYIFINLHTKSTTDVLVFLVLMMRTVDSSAGADDDDDDEGRHDVVFIASYKLTRRHLGH